MFVWNGINVDPYKVLEVPHDVTKAELGNKYKTLMKKYHTDGRTSTQRLENGMRLINQSRSEILKDIELREKDAKEQALKKKDYSALDLEGLKKTIIEQFSSYITECQVAKVTCELYQGETLKKIEEFFDQGIAAANNCITLANTFTTRDEVMRVKGLFDLKKQKFDEKFFDDLKQLLNKTIMFIRSAKEVQTLMMLIINRDKNVSAQEWFAENQDALISIVTFEEELVKKLDSVIEEYKDDEYYAYMSDDIEEKCYDIVVLVNSRLASGGVSYKIFEEDDFLEAFKIEIQGVVDKYHATMERRKNKIKYLKFAHDISDLTVEQLESLIHNGEEFDSMVDSIEMPVFNSHVNAAQGANAILGIKNNH